MASYVPSPIAQGAWFFVVSDLGKVHCFEAKTGKRLWQKQLGDHHSASPVSANGNLYFIADDGTTHVFKASGKYEPIARTRWARSAIPRRPLTARPTLHSHAAPFVVHRQSGRTA